MYSEKILSTAKIIKVRNSLGIIIPKDIQEILEIAEGDFFEFNHIEKNKIILQKVLIHHSQWTFPGKDNMKNFDYSEAELEDKKDYVPKW